MLETEHLPTTYIENYWKWLHMFESISWLPSVLISWAGKNSNTNEAPCTAQQPQDRIFLFKLLSKIVILMLNADARFQKHIVSES